MPEAAFQDATATATDTATSSGEPKKNGRPTLYSPELLEKLCARLREHGWTDHRAALSLGVNPKNLTRWKQVHEDLGPALESARSEFLSAQLKALAATETKSGVLNWRARAWIIERSFPEEYGRRAPIKVEQPREPGTDEDEAFDPRAPGAFAGMLTPFKLRVLQQLRLEQLQKLEAARAAGIAPAPGAEPPISLSTCLRRSAPAAPAAPAAAAPTPQSKQGFLETKPPKPAGLTSNVPRNADGWPMDGIAAPIGLPNHPAWHRDPDCYFIEPPDDDERLLRSMGMLT